MKCLYYFNIFVLLLLLSLFLWQCSISIMKYTSYKTSFFTTLFEEEMVLYPSVSVCKKYTFEKYLNYLFDKDSVNLTEVKELVIENSWNIEEVFYFMSHPSMLGMTFPCTTMLDGTDPGKPCVFPVLHSYYRSVEYKKLTSIHSEQHQETCILAWLCIVQLETLICKT